MVNSNTVRGRIQAYNASRVRGSRYKRPRKRGYGTGGTIRRGRTAGEFENAIAIHSLNQRIGGFEGLELKFQDTVNNAGGITASGPGSGMQDPVSQLCLNSMVQGTTATTRVGRFITMKSLYVKFTFHHPATTGSSSPPQDVDIFCAIVLDSQTNKAQMASQDVFVNPVGTAISTTSPFFDLQNSDRFRILKLIKCKLRRSAAFVGTYDTVAADTFYDVAEQTVRKQCYIKLRNMKTQFDGTAGGSVGNIVDTSIHVVCYANVTGALITYNSRLRFTST